MSRSAEIVAAVKAAKPKFGSPEWDAKYHIHPFQKGEHRGGRRKGGAKGSQASLRAQELARDPGDLVLTAKGTAAEELARDPGDLLLAGKKAGDPPAKSGRKKITRRKGGHFIQGAIQHPGALHEDLNVPAGHKIPMGKLEAAEHMPGVTGRRARFAMMLRNLPHH